MNPRRGAYLVVAVISLFIGGSRPRTPLPAPHSRVQPDVLLAVHHDLSPPLREMRPSFFGDPLVVAEQEDQESELYQERGLAHSGLAAGEMDPVMQRVSGPLLSTTPGLNFDGVATSSAWLAPDSDGAVGATQFVQWVNVRFAVYDKTTGALLMGPTAGNTLWAGFGAPCETSNSGDPIVQYDKGASRWVFSQHTTLTVGQDFQCLAVSATADATGTYNRYSFALPLNDLPDYPKLAVWPDAYYLSIDEFVDSTLVPVGPYICALDRNAMLAGAPATAQCFQLAPPLLSLLPSDLDGATAPPAGSPNYFMSLGTNALNLWKFHVDFTNPTNTTLTGPSSIPVAHFGEACGGSGACIPQSSTTQELQSLGDRLMYRLAYRNFGDHEALVVNHAVTAVHSSVGIRWYEIRSPGSTPVVFQQSTYAPNARFRWMGSIAMDRAGDIALGYNASSLKAHPSVFYSGRLSTDTLNTLETEAELLPGRGSQTFSPRWGDYSSLAIDPVDDCTFWYTTEYLSANGSRNWSTRIGSFKFTTCP
jgi:hypothetical protein